MLLDGSDWKAAIDRHRVAPNEAYIRRVLAEYRDKGYRYLRDGGDRWGVGLRAKQLSDEYGIRYRTPLAPLCKRGHYGAFIGECYENMSEFAEIVKKRRENGADFVKIMISGLMDFDRFGVLSEQGQSHAEIREAVHIAHEEGFSVMAHANGARTVEAAAAAGVDSVEHGAYLDTRALQAMRESGMVWVPTLSTVGNLLGKGRFDDAAVGQILRSNMDALQTFADMGGLIACGSDAGAWAVPHAAETEETLLEKAVPQACILRGNAKIMEKF